MSNLLHRLNVARSTVPVWNALDAKSAVMGACPVTTVNGIQSSNGVVIAKGVVAPIQAGSMRSMAILHPL